MTSYDEIRLMGIGGYGYHGVLATERQEGQPFHADVVLYLDTSQAARGDELTHTADYASVAQAVVGVIEGEPVNLIETLAARIADVVLGFGVDKVDVTVHKPQAPLGVAFSDVQVHISRSEVTGASALPAGPGIAQEAADADVAPAVGVAVPPAPPVAPPPPVVEEPVVGQSSLAPELTTPPDQPVAVVLGLGGNEGDVRHTLRGAIADLRNVEGLDITEVSPLARTVAVVAEGAPSQPDYLNAVVVAETTLSAHELLESVNRIEESHGRVREERWGQRTLDIDIITYGNVVAGDDHLTIPHPRAAQRAFVLLPWAHISPAAVIPGEGGGEVSQLAQTAGDRQGVRWMALDWLEDDTSTPTVSPGVVPQPQQEQPERVEEAKEPEEMKEPQEVAPLPPPVPDAEEPPAVADWLAGHEGEEPEYREAQPAIPVQPSFPPTHDHTNHPPEQQPQPQAPGVEWLADEEHPPPLSAQPQWLKVRRDE